MRHPLRLAVAVALLVAGGVHVPIIPAHLREAPYIGWLFIVLTVACAALAVLVIAHDTPAVYGAAAFVTALAVLGYVLSRTVGLPQIGDDMGNWLDPLGVAALVSESLTVVLAGVIAAHAFHRAPRQLSH